MVLKKKVCLLGSYGVGKTSLVRRFVYNKYEDKYLSTIGVHITKKQIDLPIQDKFDGVELFIWDIANIEKFDSTVQMYVKGSHGAIFVFDLTRPDTVDAILKLQKDYLNIVNTTKLVYVANKLDLIDKQNMDYEQYQSALSTDSSKLFFSSAKTGENVENAFTKLSILLSEEV